MSSVRVVLRKRSDPAIYFQVDLTLHIAPVTSVKSRLGDAPQALYLPDGSAHLSHVPAEAVVYSGALFALREVGAFNIDESSGTADYELVLTRVSGVYDPSEIEGFSAAGVIAIAHLTGHPEIIRPDLLSKWQLEECRIAERQEYSE